MRYIYGLTCPVSKLVHYIGLSDNPERRLEQHLSETGDSPKLQWIKSLRQFGAVPALTILAHVDEKKATEEEERWIAFGLSVGWPLKNEMLPQAQKFSVPYTLPAIHPVEILDIYNKYAFPSFIGREMHPLPWFLRPFVRADPRSDLLQVWFRAFDDEVFCMFYPFFEEKNNRVFYGPPSPNWITRRKSQRAYMEHVHWPKIIVSKDEKPVSESGYSSGHPIYGFASFEDSVIIRRGNQPIGAEGVA